MNKEFYALLMDKTEFPEEAKKELLESAGLLAKAGQEEAFTGAVEFFYENDFSIDRVQPIIEEIAEKAKLSPYTVWLLFLMEAAVPVREMFREEGIDEQIFWDTFADLRYKVLECREIHGVWGNFVAFWYPIFYSRDIVKLGRLEFENDVYDEDTPYERNGYIVKKGDKVKSIHIPSSGEPFTAEARLASYKKAYDFFQEELDGKPLICQCHSWLLNPEYGRFLPPASNFVSFQQDFDIVRQETTEEFGDDWRLFGRDCKKPVSELPERTSMQRAFKQYFLSGGKPGVGMGILIFDGEKIVNK